MVVQTKERSFPVADHPLSLLEIRSAIQNAKKRRSYDWWKADVPGHPNIKLSQLIRDSVLNRKHDVTQLFLDEAFPVSEAVDGKYPITCLAIRVGDLDQVKRLVDLGALESDLWKFKKGEVGREYELEEATKAGNRVAVEYLLSKKPYPIRGYHFLWLAATENCPEIVDLLLDHGGDLTYAFNRIIDCNLSPNERAQGLYLLLDRAQGFNFKIDLLSKLKREEVDVSGFNFIGVSIRGKPISKEDVKKAGIKGADYALYSLEDLNDIFGERKNRLIARLQKAFHSQGKLIIDGLVNLIPIDVAAENGDAAAIEARLAAKVDPNQPNAIVLAAENGHLEVVKQLASHPHINPAALVSAFNKAREKRHNENADYLYSILDVNQLDLNGNALIHEAVESGEIGEVQQLILRGADLNLRNKKGESPLNCVVDPPPYRLEQSHIFILRTLLDGGADPNPSNHTSPLEIAIQASCTDDKEDINLELVRILNELTVKKAIQNAEWKRKLIVQALLKRHWRPLLKIIEEFGKIDFKEFGITTDSRFSIAEECLLEWAQNNSNSFKEKLSYLIEQGAANDPASLFLHVGRMAYISPHITQSILECFLDHGFDFHKTSQNHHSLLHAAKEIENKIIPDFLRKLGITECAQCKKGRVVAVPIFEKVKSFFSTSDNKSEEKE